MRLERSQNACKKDWMKWKTEESWLSSLKHCRDQQEYSEVSWRHEETCCHSHSNERFPAKAVMKNLKGIMIIINRDGFV